MPNCPAKHVLLCSTIRLSRQSCWLRKKICCFGLNGCYNAAGDSESTSRRAQGRACQSALLSTYIFGCIVSVAVPLSLLTGNINIAAGRCSAGVPAACFPTCQVRVVRFYQSSSPPSSSCPRLVFLTAAPQLPARDRNGLYLNGTCMIARGAP